MDDIAFNPQLLVSAFDAEQSSHTFITATAESLVRPNPNRIVVGFTRQQGAGSIAISFQPPGSSTAGFLLGSLQENLIFLYRDWGSIVGYEWFGHDGIGADTIQIFEVIYTPDREP